MTAGRRVYAVLATTMALLVLVQAALAGRALFGPWSTTVHGVAGNVTFALAATLAWSPPRAAPAAPPSWWPWRSRSC